MRLPSLLRRDFTRSVLTLATGTLIGNGLVAAVTPLLTRLYAPADMGRAGVLTAFVNIACTAAALRYELAIVSAVDEDDATALLVGCIVLAAPVSCLLGVVLYVMITHALVGYQVLPTWAAIVAPGSLFLAACFYALRFWFIRVGEFSAVSRFFVAQNATRAAAQLSGGVARAGWVGLFIGDASARIVAVGLMAVQARSVLRERVRTFSVAALRRVAHRYREFPLVSLPSTLLDTFALNLPLPLVVKFFGVDAGGQFSLVQLVFALPLSLIGGSIGDAFHSRAAELARTDLPRVRPFFIRTSKILLLAGIGPLAIVSLAGPTLLGIIFGARWAAAGAMAAVMTPWALGQLVVSPVSRIVFIANGQRIKLIYDALNLTLVLTAFEAASMWKLSLTATVALASGFQVVGYAAYYLLLIRVIHSFEIQQRGATPGPFGAELAGAGGPIDAATGPEQL